MIYVKKNPRESFVAHYAFRRLNEKRRREINNIRNTGAICIYRDGLYFLRVTRESINGNKFYDFHYTRKITAEFILKIFVRRTFQYCTCWEIDENLGELYTFPCLIPREKHLSRKIMLVIYENHVWKFWKKEKDVGYGYTPNISLILFILVHKQWKYLNISIYRLVYEERR